LTVYIIIIIRFNTNKWFTSLCPTITRT